jgi:MbtH protein
MWKEHTVPTNPFEDEFAAYLVVVNAENQHSLWPVDIAVPDGWTIVHNSDTRQNCLAYVEEHWTDLRPASLVAAMRQTASRSGER